jgi:DNA invertase Pin-like site-specific DNA recombinase
MQPSEPITAIYARQSRKRNSSYSSCEAQVRVCQELANACRFEIRGVYIDEGESSESLDRIQMNRLLAAVDAGEVKRLIVYSIDRLTRRLSNLQKLLERFSCNQVQLLVVTDSAYSDNAVSRLMTNIVAAASEFQLELTRERMADARAALKRQGKRVAGRVPFGYVADKLARTLVVHLEQSPIVKELFRLAAQGSKPSDLARHANSCGWKNHREVTGEWTPRWITKLLTNRAYIGEIRHGTSWLPGSHKPIVTQAEFEAVQNQLALRLVRGKSRQRVSPSSNSSNIFPLEGLLFCGGCLRPMSTSVSIRGNIGYLYYRCRSYAGGRPPCRGVNMSAYEFQQLVASVLLETDHPDLSSSGFRGYWKSLSEVQQKQQLMNLVERVILNFDANELTIQFKDGLDAIISQLRS